MPKVVPLPVGNDATLIKIATDRCAAMESHRLGHTVVGQNGPPLSVNVGASGQVLSNAPQFLLDGNVVDATNGTTGDYVGSTVGLYLFTGIVPGWHQVNAYGVGPSGAVIVFPI